jgi:hypothetical protein
MLRGSLACIFDDKVDMRLFVYVVEKQERGGKKKRIAASGQRLAIAQRGFCLITSSLRLRGKAFDHGERTCSVIRGGAPPLTNRFTGRYGEFSTTKTVRSLFGSGTGWKADKPGSRLRKSIRGNRLFTSLKDQWVNKGDRGRNRDSVFVRDLVDRVNVFAGDPNHAVILSIRTKRQRFDLVVRGSLDQASTPQTGTASIARHCPDSILSRRQND